MIASGLESDFLFLLNSDFLFLMLDYLLRQATNWALSSPIDVAISVTLSLLNVE